MSHCMLHITCPIGFKKTSESGHEIRLPKRREETLETGEVNLLEEVGSEARV